MPTLSIIIPVYNAALYLDVCLESLVKQTYTDLEIICIDDGSTDASGEILRRFSQEDTRVRVFSQSNQGPSVARSLGISKSYGIYIMFMDADDFLDTDACEKLVYTMQQYAVDVVGFSYKTFPKGFIHRYSMRTEVVLRPSLLLSSTKKPQTSNDLCFAVRYMIKRSMIKKYNIKFNQHVRIGEDMLFVMELFSYAEYIYLMDYAPYNYRIDNPNSAMHNIKYNPYLEDSLTLSYQLKKQKIMANKWDKYTPFSFDLASYTIKIFWGMLIRNRRVNGETADKYIAEVLNLPMIQDAMKVIGLRNVFTNWKEYMIYLCMKFHILPVLKHYY